MSGTVYVVHCVDTEGPLHESVSATFERLRAIFGLDLEPSAGLLRQIQEGFVDLGGLEGPVKQVVDPHLLDYNDTWSRIDSMLDRIMDPSFRHEQPDSFGGGWRYNWFIVDHVGYGENPRRRDIGYLNVFDHYEMLVREAPQPRDGLYFHFHPHNFRHEAHRCATHWWASSDSLFQILNRRVIERSSFPAANRPGFHVNRPDSHWFLEQYIPFDFANQAVERRHEDEAQSGLGGGRFGDWRRAPISWEPYHPSADDYQEPGDCRRWIVRCLNVGTRYRLLEDRDVRQAFEEASRGSPVVLAVTNHDFRDMEPDIRHVREMLVEASRDFPSVSFRYSDAVEAVRDALELPRQSPCELDLELRQVDDGAYVLLVRSNVPTFGPHPWLAMKTKTGEYYHDNFDIEAPFHRWQYVFDSETVDLRSLEAVGVAANNAYGATTVSNLDPASGKVSKTFWNVGPGGED